MPRSPYAPANSDFTPSIMVFILTSTCPHYPTYTIYSHCQSTSRNGPFKDMPRSQFLPKLQTFQPAYSKWWPLAAAQIYQTIQGGTVTINFPHLPTYAIYSQSKPIPNNGPSGEMPCCPFKFQLYIQHTWTYSEKHGPTFPNLCNIIPLPINRFFTMGLLRTCPAPLRPLELQTLCQTYWYLQWEAPAHISQPVTGLKVTITYQYLRIYVIQPHFQSNSHNWPFKDIPRSPFHHANSDFTPNTFGITFTSTCPQLQTCVKTYSDNQLPTYTNVSDILSLSINFPRFILSTCPGPIFPLQIRTLDQICFELARVHTSQLLCIFMVKSTCQHLQQLQKNRLSVRGILTTCQGPYSPFNFRLYTPSIRNPSTRTYGQKQLPRFTNLCVDSHWPAHAHISELIWYPPTSKRFPTMGNLRE